MYEVTIQVDNRPPGDPINLDQLGVFINGEVTILDDEAVERYCLQNDLSRSEFYNKIRGWGIVKDIRSYNPSDDEDKNEESSDEDTETPEGK